MWCKLAYPRFQTKVILLDTHSCLFDDSDTLSLSLSLSTTHILSNFGNIFYLLFPKISWMLSCNTKFFVKVFFTTSMRWWLCGENYGGALPHFRWTLIVIGLHIKQLCAMIWSTLLEDWKGIHVTSFSSISYYSNLRLISNMLFEQRHLFYTYKPF